MNIPSRYIDMIGTEQKFTGCLFSQSKEYTEPTAFIVKSVRWGTGQIMDMDSLTPIHPTVDLLLKREGMKKAQWCRGFAVPEIKLEE